MSATLQTPCDLPGVTCRQRLRAQAARRKAWHGNARPGQAAQDGVRERVRGFRAPGPRDHRSKDAEGGDAGFIPEDTVRWCVIGDGADGMWKHVQALCPDACQVLDSYHCSESLHNSHSAYPCIALIWLDLFCGTFVKKITKSLKNHQFEFRGAECGP
jgi:hypothetical protein